MRIVITGGTGILGSHVAHLLDHPRVALSHQDVSGSLDVDGPVDAVMHLAIPASPVDYHRLPPTWSESRRATRARSTSVTPTSSRYWSWPNACWP
jgi:nucleoside-diphosphate-sugar epimerase